MRDILASFAHVQKAGNGWMARCPAHDDQKNSLSIGHGEDGRWLLKCFAGCDFDDIVAAAHLAIADLFPDQPRDVSSARQITATYDYRDEHGKELLYQVVRYAPKDFRQRRPDGQGWTWKLNGVRRVPYRLSDLHGKRAVLIPEGEKDVDALWPLALPATTNAGGVGKWRPEFAELLKAAGCQHVAVLPDNDAPGRQHAEAVARSCQAAGLNVKVVALPGLPEKGDVSDWLSAGHTREELVALVKATALYTAAPAPVTLVTACPLATVDTMFTKWLGQEYDLVALHAVLAAAAAERLLGDPLWLLVISGSGNAKTETVQALAGAGAFVTSTISSEGALLSGSAKRERAKDATGGLLRRIGDRGLLVVKDVTSILSMDRHTRASLLAALRELHDGKWERNVGTDGGRTLSWTGRIVIIGAVTTAWDRAHDVVASMGDRFVIVRMDSTTGRMPAGRRACRNTGEETQMRAELAAVVGGVLATIDPAQAITLTDAEQERLLEAADVVTLARTGVDYDYRGDVIDAHAPEMPTRFAKQLVQVVRGAVAIGLDRDEALRLAIRCARDSMPPLRLAILDDLTMHPGSQTRDVRRRLEKPRATVDRQLQSLHMLGVLTCDEEEAIHRGESVTRWRYQVAESIHPSVLDSEIQCQKCDSIRVEEQKRESEREQQERVSTLPHISGTEIPFADTHSFTDADPVAAGGLRLTAFGTPQKD